MKRYNFSQVFIQTCKYTHTFIFLTNILSNCYYEWNVKRAEKKCVWFQAIFMLVWIFRRIFLPLPFFLTFCCSFIFQSAILACACWLPWLNCKAHFLFRARDDIIHLWLLSRGNACLFSALEFLFSPLCCGGISVWFFIHSVFFVA